MRAEIRIIILKHLEVHGEQTTAQIHAAVAGSGLPASNHRHPVLRNGYLETLANQGTVELVRESPPGEGGGVWRLARRGQNDGA